MLQAKHGKEGGRVKGESPVTPPPKGAASKASKESFRTGRNEHPEKGAAMAGVTETKQDAVDLRPDGLPEGITLFSQDKIIKACGGRLPQEVFNETLEALSRPKSVAWQLKALRKNAKILLDLCEIYSEALDDAVEEFERLKGKAGERHRKRWTKEEDEALIELASRDGETPASLSVTFGRTPQAIATHLSELIGIERTQQTVLGQFVGTIGGAHVEGPAVGTVYLTKRADGAGDL